MAGFGAVNQPLIVRDGRPLTANAQLKLATAKEEVRVSTDVLDVNVMTQDPSLTFDDSAANPRREPRAPWSAGLHSRLAN